MKFLGQLGGTSLLIGLGLLFGALFFWHSSAIFIAHAATAEGVVVDLAYSSSSKGGGYAPVVKFTTVNGHALQMTGSVFSRPSRYSRGDRVRVFYDRARPEQAQIDAFMDTWFLPLVMGGIGLVFTLSGCGAIFVHQRQRKVREWLAQNGMRVQAKLEGINVDTSLSVNGRNPWRLSCQWQHPVTQKVYLFRSDPLWFDPAPFVKRDQLDVLVNMDNPGQYQVDTSFLPTAG